MPISRATHIRFQTLQKSPFAQTILKRSLLKLVTFVNTQLPWGTNSNHYSCNSQSSRQPLSVQSPPERLGYRPPPPLHSKISRRTSWLLFVLNHVPKRPEFDCDDVMIGSSFLSKLSPLFGFRVLIFFKVIDASISRRRHYAIGGHS